MVAAISTYPSFTGAAKETTYGTPVTVTTFSPATTIAFEDLPNYAADQAMRGSAVDTYNMIPTQKWGSFSYGSPVYMDTVGLPLKGLFGAEALTGAGPYIHKFSTLNTGTFQPPSYTLVDYNGFEALSYPGGLFSQVEFSFSATELLTAAFQGLCQSSSPVTKPSQSFSTKTAMAGYNGVIQVAGSANTMVESGTVTLARQLNPLPLINQSSAPIWAGSVSATGSLTAVYVDDTFRTPLTSGTSVALDFTFTNGADILQIHGSNCLFTAGPITRNSNGWMEQAISFTAVANTADATSGGGTGYSPMYVQLTNSTSTVY